MTVLSLQQTPSSPPPMPPQQAQQAQADGTYSPIPAELQVDPAQYELLDYQARGGFGCVFTAIHIPTGQKVAIKLFDYIHCKPSDPAYVDVEIESMRRVRHILGFARLLGCFYDSEEGIATGRQVRYWSMSGEREFVDTARKLGAQKHGVRRQKVLVLELCQGGEVFDRINLLAEQGRSFELVHASDIVRSVCATFQQLHASRLINPDFKPENCVFVSPDLSLFEVKVIDLGAMCHVPEGQSEIVNRDALITPSLQAPESHQRGVFSFKSDVFQVGCFLFMILAAAVPFDDYGRKSRDFDHWMGAIRARSVAAHDLLCRLLCPSPDERISVPDILRHPFVAEPQSLAAAVGAGGSGPDAAYIERVRGLLLRKRLRVLLQACAEVGRRQREAVLQLELAQSEQQAAGEGAGAGHGAGAEGGILDLGRLAAKLDGGVFVQLKARFLEKCGHDVKSEISKEAFRSILETCDEPSLRVLADERIFDRVSGIFDRSVAAACGCLSVCLSLCLSTPPPCNSPLSPSNSLVHCYTHTPNQPHPPPHPNTSSATTPDWSRTPSSPWR